MSDRHLGRMTLSREFFELIMHHALCLPAGARVAHVEISPQWNGRLAGVDVYIEHESLPCVYEGEQVSHISYLINSASDVEAVEWSKGKE